MKQMRTNWVIKDFSEHIPIETIDELRDATNIGDEITFTKEVYEFYADTGRYRKFDKPISGVIAKKFSHVFMFEDGRTFTWKDYYMGRNTNERTEEKPF